MTRIDGLRVVSLLAIVVVMFGTALAIGVLLRTVLDAMSGM